ncbi:hypothetical protein [Candidatus Pelagibacter sp. HIMB1517]|uniref:hypothetical protein n=1 Tax=Candidatus Pelagibacter sp. HIMB1517 TaxID=3413341 RepID=UPI003F83EEEE
MKTSDKNSEREVGIGHNSENLYDNTISGQIKIAFNQLLDICYEFAENRDESEQLANESRNAKNHNDRIEKHYEMRQNLNKKADKYNCLRLAKLSTMFGKQTKEHLDKHPTYKHEPRAVCNDIANWFDEPLDQISKEEIEANFPKELAQSLIKENEEAWSWYETE